MNNLQNIIVKCEIDLNEAVVSMEELKQLTETKTIELTQIEGKEVKISIGEEEKKTIAYGIIVVSNGRYGVRITELAEE